MNLEGNPATRQVFYFNNGPGGAPVVLDIHKPHGFCHHPGNLDQSPTRAIPDDGNWHHLAVVH